MHTVLNDSSGWRLWPVVLSGQLQFFTAECEDWIVALTVGKGWFRGVAHGKGSRAIEFLPRRRNKLLHKMPLNIRMGTLMSYVKRLTGSSKNGMAVAVPNDEQMQAEYPALWEHLTSTRYDDGKPRKTMSMTLFCEEGKMKACLTDRDSSYVAFVSGDGLFDLLRVVEEALATGNVEWRKSRWRTQGKG